MMARRVRGARKRFWRRGRDDEGVLEPSSRRELTDLVADHLIPEAQRGATAQWHPSRRGNSPERTTRYTSTRM